jgi:hypothetical protein
VQSTHRHSTQSTTWAFSMLAKASWARLRRCTSERCKGRRRHSVQSTHRHSTRSTTWAASTGTKAKLGEAEKMYQRALQGYEKALDAEHTSTLNTVNNLGNLQGPRQAGQCREDVPASAARIREGAWSRKCHDLCPGTELILGPRSSLPRYWQLCRG